MRRLLSLAALLICACDPAVPPPAPPCNDDLDCPEAEHCTADGCVPRVDVCAPLASCPGGCADVARDPQNCGACGVSCGEGVGCTAGACCPGEAPAACGGRCTELSSDPTNCGACGVVCGEGLACAGGGCCPEGRTKCETGCRDLATDPGTCGACGTRCPTGAGCSAGSCEPCPAGTVEVECGPASACLPAGGPLDPPCRRLVPGGTFEMGFAGDDLVGTRPRHAVTLTHAYYLDLYEATQGELQRCVDAGSCPGASPADPTRSRVAKGGLRWQDATDYCAFRGGRLPTEAEWEHAAGGDEGAAQPWGWLPQAATDCSYAAIEQCVTELQPGGSFPLGAGGYGQVDFLGNVSEWVSDYYDVGFYAVSPAVDPTGPATGTQRILRGGEIGDSGRQIWYRGAVALDDLSQHAGVRCAFPVP